MPANKLREFLNSQQVKYVTISHSPAYTAQEVAASAHVRGKDLAKTVMVTLDGRMAMVVLPASRKVGFDLLREVSGAENVQLASERAFSDMFPGCEVGAMPPFGNLYGMDVYASKLLGRGRGNRLQRRQPHRADPPGLRGFRAAGESQGRAAGVRRVGRCCTTDNVPLLRRSSAGCNRSARHCLCQAVAHCVVGIPASCDWQGICHPGKSYT